VGRVYQLGGRDTVGLYLGLAAPQVAAIVAGVVVGLAGFAAGVPTLMPIGLIAGGVLGVGRWRGQPMLDLAPGVMRVMVGRMRRRPWLAPLGLFGDEAPAAMPPCLAGLVLIDVPAGKARAQSSPVGVVVDTKTGHYAATLRVRGRDFVLAEAAEREALVDGWGQALAGFASSAAVSSVTWMEWAAPTGMAVQEAFLAEHGNPDPSDPAVASYRRLLGQAGSLATRHEVLVTVTLNSGKVRPRRGADRAVAAVEELLTEVRLFGDRLAAGGLTVSGPLGASEVARALRFRLDPSCQDRLEHRSRSLAELAGVVSPSNCGPLSTEAGLRWWRADGSLHRSFVVAEWPRRPLTADWMGGLILEAGCVRSIAVVFRPEATAASLARAEHKAAQLEGDGQHRAEKGFRLGARFQAAREAVAHREAELVAGHVECRHVGVVSVAAADEESLDEADRQVTQTAARWGVELRPLDGRHDQGLVACLPVARRPQ
jgi:hypothetical protein